MLENRITLRAVVLGALASGLFAWYTVLVENMGGQQSRILTATQIPVLPFLLLILFALVINPALRRLRFPRVLSSAEVMVVFIMTMVSSGISTFGLASHLVPAIGGLFNRDWNTAQARWDRYVEPFVNEAFFIAEPGIQAGALEARAAEDVWREADTVLRSARALAGARHAVADIERQLTVTDRELPASEQSRLSWQLLLDQGRLAEAEQRWATVGEGHDVDGALVTLPEQVDVLRAEYDRRRALLAELEEQAFAKVDLFRRGLPDALRAIPGLLPALDEPFAVYATRLRRLRAGLRASGELTAARRALAADRATVALGALRRARQRLDAVADDAPLRATRDRLSERRDAIDPELVAVRRQIDQLRAERRMSDADDIDVIDRAIRVAETEAGRLTTELQTIADELQRVVAPRLALTREIAEVRDRIDAAIADLEYSPPRSEPAVAAVAAGEDAIAALNISWRAMFAGDVPWRDWLAPLARWSLLILVAYLMLMTFNGLVFRQWAHHEKLAYPLADLPLSLAGAAGDESPDRARGSVPAVYRSGLFWAGFAVSAFTMGWNIMAARQIIPGIKPIPLRVAWQPFIAGSPLSGLLPSAHHQVFFTMIGLAFLIPARISKSLWGFHVVYMGLLLVLVWLGYGVDERSFPSNMTLVMNFRGGVGGGALIAFSAMTLWTCRRYLLCIAMPAAVAGLEPAERIELRVSSLLFIASSLGLILLLAFGMGANIWYAVFCYLMIMVITIGLMRSVAEGGLLVLQAFFGPFHAIRSVFGMNKSWTSSSLFAPLVVFYYMLFWDLKTFIAPAMANAYKIRDGLGLRRLGFHLTIWLGIVTAAVVSVATHIILSYDRGANSMHHWFYTNAPRELFGGITDMAIANPVDEAGGLYWILAGLLVMSALLAIRRRRFGVWHPIGLVMWIHPGMWALWFSIFLGWIFKTLVGRYGDRTTYQRFRTFFIGLIVGELLMCLFGVDLNRHGGWSRLTG